MITSATIPSLGEELVKAIVALPDGRMEFYGTTLLYADADQKVLVIKEKDGALLHIVGLPFIVRTRLKSEKK